MLGFSKSENKVYFDIFTIEKGHNEMSYRELPLRKCPFDYVMYQMILFETKPDLIIEIGTDKGGSALYLADLLDILGKGLIHTLDIKDELSDIVKNHKRIVPFYKGWQQYDLEKARSFNKILIIDDSTHYYEDTFEILNLFSSLINVGSYFIVEDGIVDNLGISRDYRGGPVRAINKFLEENHDFIVDKKWCNFFGTNATFNVNGYLKRITKSE